MIGLAGVVGEVLVQHREVSSVGVRWTIEVIVVAGQKAGVITMGRGDVSRVGVTVGVTVGACRRG
jgi:hypothetical protein